MNDECLNIKKGLSRSVSLLTLFTLPKNVVIIGPGNLRIVFLVSVFFFGKCTISVISFANFFLQNFRPYVTNKALIFFWNVIDSPLLICVVIQVYVKT